MTSAGTKPRVWPVFVAYLAALGAMSTAGTVMLVVAVVSRGLAGELPKNPDPEAFEALALEATTAPWFILASAAISATLLAAVALVGAKLSPMRFVGRLRLGPARGIKWCFAVGPLAAVAALTSGSAVMSALMLIVGRKSDALAALEKAVLATGPVTLALAFVIVALAVPFGEEAFFRGYAQTRLTARFGRGPGMLMATVLFALLHIDPMHIAVAFAIGLVLAWTTERTGSIRAAIFAHAANNGLFVLGSQGTGSSPTWKNAVLLLMVAVLALAGIAFLTRSATRELAGP